jgi:phytoene synthase
MNRSYFPGVDLQSFSEEDKKSIEAEIEADFKAGLGGIRLLPRDVLFGVYLSYAYFYALFRKIREIPAEAVMKQRIRIPDAAKYRLLVVSYIRFLFGWL